MWSKDFFRNLFKWNLKNCRLKCLSNHWRVLFWNRFLGKPPFQPPIMHCLGNGLLEITSAKNISSRHHQNNENIQMLPKFRAQGPASVRFQTAGHLLSKVWSISILTRQMRILGKTRIKITRTSVNDGWSGNVFNVDYDPSCRYISMELARWTF